MNQQNEEVLTRLAYGYLGRRDASTFRVPGSKGRNWCALWITYLFEELDWPTPKPDERARRGAKALTRWVASRGQWVINPEDRASKCSLYPVRKGDVVCWNRGTLSWTGHVALVYSTETDRILTIGGNESGAVALKAFSYDGFLSRLKGLYGVARIL